MICLPVSPPGGAPVATQLLCPAAGELLPIWLAKNPIRGVCHRCRTCPRRTGSEDSIRRAVAQGLALEDVAAVFDTPLEEVARLTQD